jgi:hypothetical protein
MMMALMLLICIVNVQAILMTKKFKVKGSNKFMFLHKFAIGEDKHGTLRARFRFVKPYVKYVENQETLPVYLNIYKYNAWDRSLLLDENDCSGKRTLSTSQNTHNVPLNGEWTVPMAISLEAGRQTQVHYVAVDD